jgi:Ni,Fe-hydrogenase III small subunit
MARLTYVWAALRAVAPLLGRELETETGESRTRRSIAVRHVDGGSSNAVEVELAALSSPVYDMAQYGVHFVASPRHADVLLLSGPLTWNMLGALRAAFDAMPEPRRVIAIGPCLGGADTDQCTRLFASSYALTSLPDEMTAPGVRAGHVEGDPPEPRAVIAALVALETT